MIDIVNEAIEEYASRSTKAEPELLQSLIVQTYDKMEMPQMLTGRLEGRLLKMLVQLCRPELIYRS